MLPAGSCSKKLIRPTLPPDPVGVVTGGAWRAIRDDVPVVREGAGLVLDEEAPVVALVAHRVGLG